MFLDFSSLLTSFQSSLTNGKLRALTNLLIGTSKPTGGLQTCFKDITNNQGHILQMRQLNFYILICYLLNS